MKYAVDKIEGDIIVLENVMTGEILNKNLSEFSFGIKEKDILIYKENKFILDGEDKNNRLNLLREKMEKLKRRSWFYRYKKDIYNERL